VSGHVHMPGHGHGHGHGHGSGSGSGLAPNAARTPSPQRDRERRDLTPIAGSEATDGRSDDGRDYENNEHMSLEMRREMERQKLEEEERRVEAAQMEYRRRMADGGSGAGPAPLPKSVGGVPRAVSIQNRVQSLLSEDQKATPIQRTAQGYGKYSDAATAASKPEKPAPEVPRKPLMVSKTRVDSMPLDKRPATPGRVGTGTSSAPSNILPSKPTGGRPAAPKKPVHLNSLPTGSRPESPAKQAPPERLIAADLPGQPVLEMSGHERDNYLEDFSKRFPSLNSIEMVERDIGGGQGGGRR
jgi:AP2-associated kinase